MRPWLKFRDACQYLAMSPRKVRELTHRDLPHVKLATGMVRFNPDDLDRYMRRHAVNALPEKSAATPEIKSAADAVMEKL